MTLIVKRSGTDDDVDADECVAILSSSTSPLTRRRSLFVPIAAASTSSFTGIAITVVTSFAYATVATITKYINTTYQVPLLELIVLLVGFQALPAVLGLSLQGLTPLLWSGSLWRQHGWRLVARGVCGVFVNLLQLTAMTQMPIGNASVVFWTCPVFVALISLLFLGERLTPVKCVCIAACLGGCALVTKSEALFSAAFRPNAPIIPEEHPLAFLYALGAAMLQATAFVVLRALRQVNPFVIITYYGLIGGAVSAVWAGAAAYHHLVMPFAGGGGGGALAWPLLLLLAASLNAAANVAQAYACREENANVVGLVSSLELVFTYSWQVVLFKEVPDWLSIAGAALVLASVVMLGVEKGIVVKAVIGTTPTANSSRAARFKS